MGGRKGKNGGKGKGKEREKEGERRGGRGRERKGGENDLAHPCRKFLAKPLLLGRLHTSLPESAALCLIARKLKLLISRPAEGRRLSRPA